MQTNVSYASRKGIPGQIADLADCDVVTAVATTTLLPGTWCELALAADGETMIANSPKSVSANLADGGVVVYYAPTDAASLPAIGATADQSSAGYPVNTVVGVLRRGRIFVSTDAATTAGSTGLFLGAANVQHPSTTAASATNTNGFFTIVTANTTSGTETTAAPGVTFVRMAGTQVALVDVNRPKAG